MIITYMKEQIMFKVFLNFNFIIGLFLFVIGTYLLCQEDVFGIMDIVLAIINWVIFFVENKEKLLHNKK